MAKGNNPNKLIAAEAARKRKAADQAKAKAMAAKDAALQPQPIDEASLVKRGKQVPLAVLNQQQRNVDTQMRDEVRDASIAAAKAVQKSLKTGGGRLARRAAKMAGATASAE